MNVAVHDGTVRTVCHVHSLLLRLLCWSAVTVTQHRYTFVGQSLASRDAAKPRSRAASKRQQSIIDYYDAAQRSGEHLLAPPTQAAAIHLST